MQRIYIVDSNDLVLIKRKYQNLGWQYFENNYANDEFNNDAIFYYDSIDEKELMKMNIKESCHQNDVSASLVKGLFFGTVFLIFSVICPNLMIHVNNNGLDFILGNLYIITALTLIVMAVIGKLRNKSERNKFPFAKFILIVFLNKLIAHRYIVVQRLLIIHQLKDMMEQF